MLFNSYVFLLVFLPAVIVLVAMGARTASRALALGAMVAASAVFYGTSSIGHLALLTGSILVNWWLAGLVSRHRGWLTLGVIFNLGLLGVFKYAGFFGRTIQDLGLGAPEISLALPLAISFYTFQQIAFLVDTARLGVATRPGILTYATFVGFFPQLVAGPIVRYREVANRLGRTRPFRISGAGLRLGATLVVIGLAKKVLIADTLAVVADSAFNTGSGLTLLDSWIGVVAFGLQIYFDFSGYSDIAIGLARMVGIRLPDNFAAPYRAGSIADFWSRWHMTLSRFLRDYLYIPLGGNRHGRWRTALNLMLVMALGGLWHGANWTFVIWGLLHGLYLMVHRLWRWLSPVRLPRPAAWALTFVCVMVAWVFFRAHSLDAAVAMLRAMSTFDTVYLPLHFKTALGGLVDGEGWVRFAQLPVATPFAIGTVGASLALVLFAPTAKDLTIRARGRWVSGIAVGAGFGLVLFKLLERPHVFIYFNF